MTATPPLPLTASALPALAAALPVPTYPRDPASAAIVHFGVGAFHRSHEAMFLDRLLAAGADGDTRGDRGAPAADGSATPGDRGAGTAGWTLCGVGLLPGDAAMRDVLRAQDHLYTLVTRAPDGTAEARVIGSIVDYLFAPDDPEAVVERLASPTTRIVSLTVTEAGYPIDDTTGAFIPDHAGIAADLASPRAPQGVFGFLAEGLRRRRERGIAPFTVLSCDNIPSNGRVARTALVSFARLVDADLAAWIDAEVSFPSSMVDRITPATTDEGRAEVAERWGVDDAWPVLSESFVQWVLEDDFPLGRPALEKAGVQLVDDAWPYELMKLRLLNASHQAMSYLGLLAGFTSVHEVCRDEGFAQFLRSYMATEAIPTLNPVPGIDLDDYCRQLLERFASEAVADTLARQVVDGSSRLPKFLLPVLRDQLRAGGPIRRMATVLAAWGVWLAADEGVVDHRHDLVVAAARREETEPGALLDVTEVFGDLGGDPRLRAEYAAARALLVAEGPVAAMAAALRTDAAATTTA